MNIENKLNRISSIFFVASITIILVLIFNCFAADDTGDYIHYRLGVKYKDEKRYDDAIDEFRKVLAEYPDNYNAYMYMAEIRQLQGQSNLVVFNLKKALKYNPGWNKAHKMLAEAYVKDGQNQNAIGELQLYMQSCDPAEKDSLQRMINKLLSKTSGMGSDSLFRQDNKKSPNGIIGVSGTNKFPKDNRTNSSASETGDPVIDAKFKNAVQLYEQQKFDESLNALKEVRSLRPDFAGVYYYGGLIRRKTGQNKMAKINFLRAVDYPQQGFNAHLYLGKIFAEEKNYDEAIRQLTFYLQKTTDEGGKKEAKELIEAYEKLGGKHLNTSDISDTNIHDSTLQNKPIPQEKFTSSIEIQIDSLLSMVTIDTLTDAGQKLLNGIHEFSAGHYDQAIHEFRKILTTNPTGTVAMNCIYNTGVCYYKMHLFKEAENQFQQVIEKFSGQSIGAQSLFLKACTYLERGEAAIAEKLLREFLQTYKDHSWTGIAFEKLGDSYTEMDQDKKAIDAYIMAADKASKPSEQVGAYFKLGNCFVKIGNSSRAIESFSSALTIGEKHSTFMRVPDSYYRIADEKYKLKDYDGALEYYIKVTRKYPAFQETPWGMFQIGTIYKNLKQYQDAVTVFKDLIRKYPDDYWSKQAQWKMEDAIWENEYKSVLH